MPGCMSSAASGCTVGRALGLASSAAVQPGRQRRLRERAGQQRGGPVHDPLTGSPAAACCLASPTVGRFATRREAKLAVFDYLETFYNPRRRHCALGHISPTALEARHDLERPTEHTVTTAA
jgi:hypothetical protein